MTVISDNDIDKLRSDLPKSLEQRAKEKLRREISGDKTAIENYIDVRLSGESFDKKEGDEAKEITLKADVTFDFLAYNKNDMHALALKLFEGGNYMINKNGEKIMTDDLTSCGDVIYFNAAIPHGVETIDPGEKIDWSSFRGRWMVIFAVNKLFNTGGSPDAIDIGKEEEKVAVSV